MSGHSSTPSNFPTLLAASPRRTAMPSKSFLVGVFFGLATAFTLAQEITGDIRGLVRDPSGAVLSGANVQVINTDRNSVIRSLKTAADGAYVAPLLPVGHYKIAVTAP